MNLIAPLLTLVIGFAAAWITISPPSTKPSRNAWLFAFALLTVIAIVGTVASARQDDNRQEKLSTLLTESRRQTGEVFIQNGKLYSELEEVKSIVKISREEAVIQRPTLPAMGTAGRCLQGDVQQELNQINSFLQYRLNKSPAHDPRYANDPQCSEKEEAYEQETARQYIQKFWPSIQPLLQRAVAAGITPEGAEAFANSGYYPEDRWWQAMLKPGYRQLIAISVQAPNC